MKMTLQLNVMPYLRMACTRKKLPVFNGWIMQVGNEKW